MEEKLGRYTLREELARGACGIIYRADDDELGREVALKTMRAADAALPARERFLREARAAAALRHPNIVPVYESGEQDGRPFYTMPLLDGTPLRGPLPPMEACRIVAAVARAAAHAHARGIVHRDLKPSNILLAAGEPVVTDFGSARVDADPRLTETGELLGTPVYMSPEQVRGRGKDAGGAVDVYALGVILFELLSGRLPFDADNFVELSAKILNDAPPALPGFDPGLEALVHRCLSKDAAARPDASSLARALERWAPASRRAWPARLALVAAAAGALAWTIASTASVPPTGGMARVPAGTYEVGDPRFGRRAAPTEGFWIDRDESPLRLSGWSYVDAVGYCLRQGKRLPSEDEWEIAAGGRLFPWGDAAEPARASCAGARGPNPRDVSPIGCNNMAGNLAEWTASPGRGGDELRIVRGGHWQAPVERCTTYSRDELPVTRRLPTLGFRCASSVAPEAIETRGPHR